jgi:NDP-sugar pyrophosphorylase family protein
MEAMILAAGAGERLRPLTDNRPKALIEVGGRPLLGWVMDRLVKAGATRIIINTHYHEDQVRAFLRRDPVPDVEIAISPEPGGPYETGGGVFAAAHLFQSSEPFLLHNVDVLSAIPLDGLLAGHATARERAGSSLIASLAVQSRAARRRLLFDDVGLMGWENRGSDRVPGGSHRVRQPVGELTRWSFTGIHVLEPSVFGLSERTGAFSIITLYLELARQGHVILPIDVSAHDWIDVGTHERLAEAERRKGGTTERRKGGDTDG